MYLGPSRPGPAACVARAEQQLQQCNNNKKRWECMNSSAVAKR
jgi:hypothetical protein